MKTPTTEKNHSFNRNLKKYIYVFSKELQTLNCYKHFSIYTFYIIKFNLFLFFYILYIIFFIFVYIQFICYILIFPSFKKNRFINLYLFFCNVSVKGKSNNETTLFFHFVFYCSGLFVIFIRLNTTMRHDRSLETELNQTRLPTAWHDEGPAIQAKKQAKQYTHKLNSITESLRALLHLNHLTHTLCVLASRSFSLSLYQSNKYTVQTNRYTTRHHLHTPPKQKKT